MRRKVIKQGNGTLTVTLPKPWTEKIGLKGGDEIEVTEKDYVLLISKELSGKGREISLRFTDDSKRYIRSHIGRLYRLGYSKIHISFDSPGMMKVIKKATDDLIGSDVIDFTKTKCSIRIFPTEEPVDFDKNLVKVISTLKYMMKIIREDIESGEFKREDTLHELRNNNWKLKDYVMRNAFLKSTPYEEFSVLNTILFSYEKIGTNLLGFYRMYLEGLKGKINAKKLAPVFDKIDTYLDWFMKQVSRKKEIPALEESRFRKELREYHIYLFNKLHKDKVIDHPLLTIVYFTAELLDSTVSYLSLYKLKYGDYFSASAIS